MLYRSHDQEGGAVNTWYVVISEFPSNSGGSHFNFKEVVATLETIGRVGGSGGPVEIT